MLTKQKAISWIMTFADEVIDREELLSNLDRIIGNGDHGSNMARGLRHVKKTLVSSEPYTLKEVFTTTASILINKVGGASGPLFGGAFMAMANTIRNEDLSRDEITEMINAGLSSIRQRGEAQVGDKTMVDLWQPIVQALADEKLSLVAIDAALEGTRELKALKGHAANYGERSIGYPDPGAYSSSLLFKSLLKTGGLDE